MLPSFLSFCALPVLAACSSDSKEALSLLQLSAGKIDTNVEREDLTWNSSVPWEEAHYYPTATELGLYLGYEDEDPCPGGERLTDFNFFATPDLKNRLHWVQASDNHKRNYAITINGFLAHIASGYDYEKNINSCCCHGWKMSYGWYADVGRNGYAIQFNACPGSVRDPSQGPNTKQYVKPIQFWAQRPLCKGSGLNPKPKWVNFWPQTPTQYTSTAKLLWEKLKLEDIPSNSVSKEECEKGVDWLPGQKFPYTGEWTQSQCDSSNDKQIWFPLGCIWYKGEIKWSTCDMSTRKDITGNDGSSDIAWRSHYDRHYWMYAFPYVLIVGTSPQPDLPNPLITVPDEKPSNCGEVKRNLKSVKSQASSIREQLTELRQQLRELTPQIKSLEGQSEACKA